MKDEIIEILKNTIEINYVDDWCHEEYHSRPVIVGHEKSADEILALPLYPKEFVEWLALNAFTDANDTEDGYEYCVWDIETYQSNEPERFDTLDELYEYWQQNIKGK